MSTGGRAPRQEQFVLTSDGREKLDPHVVAECYHAYGDPLRRFVFGLIRDLPLASDIVQTTFARLAERGHEVEPGKRKAWLYRVAYNEAMLQRRRRALGDRALQRAVWASETLADAALQELVRDETIDRVREAVDRLPPPLREIVRLRIYEEKTFAVIARELGIPLGTALGRMRTALARLRQALADEQED